MKLILIVFIILLLLIFFASLGLIPPLLELFVLNPPLAQLSKMAIYLLLVGVSALFFVKVWRDWTKIDKNSKARLFFFIILLIPALCFFYFSLGAFAVWYCPSLKMPAECNLSIFCNWPEENPSSICIDSFSP